MRVIGETGYAGLVAALADFDQRVIPKGMEGRYTLNDSVIG